MAANSSKPSPNSAGSSSRLKVESVQHTRMRQRTTEATVVRYILALFCGVAIFLTSSIGWNWLALTLFPPTSEVPPDYTSNALYWCAQAIVSSAFAFGAAILCAGNRKKPTLLSAAIIIIMLSWVYFRPLDMNYNWAVSIPLLPFAGSIATAALLYFILSTHEAHNTA